MMELHVVIQLWVLTAVRDGFLSLSLAAEAVIDGDCEFDEFVPLTIGSMTTLMFVTAHRCPVVERS